MYLLASCFGRFHTGSFSCTITLMFDFHEERLAFFLQTRLEPFTLKDLLRFVGEPLSEIFAMEVSSFLSFHQLAYTDSDAPDLNDVWISRLALFTGKPCVIVPDRTELSAGVFFPGSRLVPFTNPGILPHELTFRFKGKLLPRVRVEVSYTEVSHHYSLFGEEYTPQYLALDNEENDGLFSVEGFEIPSRFVLSAVDFRQVYWNSGFSPGDRILATQYDWTAGAFDIEILPASMIDAEKKERWMHAMESSLEIAFGRNGTGSSIDEQLAHAWFLGRNTLFSPHAATMDEFLSWSKRIAIEPYGVETRLWFAGQDIPSQKSWVMPMANSGENILDEAFLHLGLPLNTFLMDSYIFDALFRGEKNVDAALARMVPSRYLGKGVSLPMVAQSMAIRFHIEMNRYNRFADHERGQLRNRFVDLHNALMLFLGEMEFSRILPDSIPEQGAVILGQIMNHTVSSLFNLDFPQNDEPLDYESMWASIEGMEDSFFETRTMIQELMPELLKRRFSVIKNKKENHCNE